MTTFEQDILRYLDGTLDERSSEALLSAVASDPAKQALFNQHVKLHELFAKEDDRVGAPIAVQRTLAEKIPVLVKRLPYLAPLALSDRATQVGFFGRVANSVSTYLSQVSLTTGLLIGGGVLGVGGLVYFANSERAVGPTSSAPVAVAPIIPTPPVEAPSEVVNSTKAESDAAIAKDIASDQVKPHAGTRLQRSVVSGNSQRAVLAQNSSKSARSTELPSASESSNRAEDRDVVRDQPIVKESIAKEHDPIAAREESSISKEQPTEQQVADAPAAIGENPQMGEMPKLASQRSNIRTSLVFGSSLAFLPRVAGSGAAPAVLQPQILVMAAYSITPKLDLGVEAGFMGVGGQLTTEGRLDDRTPGLVDYVITRSNLTEASGTSYRAFGSYSLAEGDFGLRLQAAVGLFTTAANAGPSAAVAFISNYRLSSAFNLLGRLGGEGLWLNSIMTGNAPDQGRLGINNTGAVESKLFTPSIGIGIGLEFRP